MPRSSVVWFGAERLIVSHSITKGTTPRNGPQSRPAGPEAP